MATRILSKTPSKIRSAGVAPTIEVGDAPGATGTAVFQGICTDLQGQILISTDGDASQGNVCSVTYANSFVNGSTVILEPADSATADATLSFTVYPNSDEDGFTINTDSNGLGANSSYQWNYIVIGN